MLGRLRFVIVQEPARRLRSLVEQGGENGLEMRRVWLGCYYEPSASVIHTATSEPTDQLQRSLEVFIFHLWRQQGTLRQFSGSRSLTRIVLQQAHDNYIPTFSLQKKKRKLREPLTIPLSSTLWVPIRRENCPGLSKILNDRDPLSCRRKLVVHLKEHNLFHG